MQYKRLGNSGVLVSDIALGTMIFGEEGPRGTPEDESINMIHRYIDMGGNHIDTANVYAGGRSEEIVGRALKGHRDRVVLATKVRFPTGDGVNQQGLSRYNIMRAAEASLRRLNTDTIDLYYMHCWDPLTPIEESLRAFDDLVTSGKVRYIGVSNFKGWQLMKALATSDANGWSRFVAGQYQHSLVERNVEYEFSDLALQEGVGMVPWGPLGGGFLSGKYTRDQRPSEGRIAVMPDHVEEAWDKRNVPRNWDILDEVDAIAQARDVTYSQIALAWLRARPEVSSVIIGTRTMTQFDDNMAAAEIDLTQEEIDKLDEVSQPDSIYPYRMIDSAGRQREATRG